MAWLLLGSCDDAAGPTVPASEHMAFVFLASLPPVVPPVAPPDMALPDTILTDSTHKPRTVGTGAQALWPAASLRWYHTATTTR